MVSLADEREASDDEEEDDWERQQFQKAIRQRQVESARQEMAMHQQYVEGSPSSSRSPARELKAIKGPASSSRSANKPSSSGAPDLSKLAPLPSPQELQEKLRERYVLLTFSFEVLSQSSFLWSQPCSLGRSS